MKLQDFEGHFLRVSGTQFGDTENRVLTRNLSSNKFCSLKCRSKYPFPVLTNTFVSDQHSHQNQLKILWYNRKYLIVITAAMTWA